MAILPYQSPSPITVPSMDFSPLAKLGEIYKERKMVAEMQQLAAQSGGKPDLAALGQVLLKHGNVEGFKGLAQLANSQEMQRANLAINQGQLDLQRQGQDPDHIRRVARTKAEVDQEFAPKTTNIKVPGGEELTVEKGPGGFKLPQIAGAPTEPNNPFAPGGKQTEAQSKDSLYASRMFGAEKVLREVETVGTNWFERAKGKVSDKTGFNLRGPEYQKFDQAQRDFINATLRRESGAVISESEFDNANKQYFPQPGDTGDLIKQKRANRAEAIKGIAGGGGSSYRPPATFDAAGNLVPLPARATTKADQPPAKAQTDVLTQARDALAKGAPREAVLQRLRERGIDPAGL